MERYREEKEAFEKGYSRGNLRELYKAKKALEEEVSNSRKKWSSMADVDIPRRNWDTLPPHV